jgi:hypothetical protein
MDDEAKPYLLTDASGLTGLSVEALRKRIERKSLRGTRSNEDGQWRVWLTSIQAVGEIEHWIAEQRWEAIPGGGAGWTTA